MCQKNQLKRPRFWFVKRRGNRCAERVFLKDCTVPIYMSFFIRKNAQLATLTKTEMKMAKTKPHGAVSIPFARFMPKIEAMSVGNIIMMVTEVSVRIVVFILLFMI